MDSRIEEEKGRIKEERKTMIKDALLILIAAAALTTFLLVWKGQITGMHSLQTIESAYFISGSSDDESLSFERIPNFIAKVGEDIEFKVIPNSKDVEFSDNSRLFNITQEGIVHFISNEKDVGTHNAVLIIMDKSGHYYCQNVQIIIEEN